MLLQESNCPNNAIVNDRKTEITISLEVRVEIMKQLKYRELLQQVF